jgi:hypothetical protein
MREPSGSADGSAGVVLLVPEALGDPPDAECLRRTLAGSSRPARVLLYLTANAGREFPALLAKLGVPFQILLADDAAELKTEALCLRAPRGMPSKDQTEFALALCDWVLVASKSDQHPVATNASRLGMTLIVPGEPLPERAAETFTHRLDPESPGWRIFRRINGRLEQVIVESLAFGWASREMGGRAESWKRLRRCFGSTWGAAPYFAPNNWRNLSPDLATIDPTAPIATTFDAMDRSALHGSYIHRDLTWLTHFGAAFAVFAAVAGYVFERFGNWVPVASGIFELVTLFLVAFAVYRTRRSGLQDRWTACRLAAEQLRIARMSLPLLVLPPALATQEKRIAGHGDSGDKLKSGDKLEFEALAQVKRAVRDQGLPRLREDFNPESAAKWVKLIVSDQRAYHQTNDRKLEHAEKRLRRVTQAIFAVALIAVVAHLIEVLTHSGHHEWLLLFTAAGPALAAALHGAGMRMGIVHRAALSKAVEEELESIDASLVEFLKAPKDTREAWGEVRDLAYKAANAMGRENTSWHGLVRRYRDELP